MRAMSINAFATRERVVCLHCSASSGRQWDPIAALLRTRFEVVAPELLGYTAGAAWPSGAPVSLDAEARALAPLLDAHRQSVHLVGHSYGAAVALQLALRWPSRVKSLTLYEPVRFALLFGTGDSADAADEIVRVGRRIGLSVLSGRHHAAAALFVGYWSGAGAWNALSPGRRDALAARMPKVQAEFEALFADRVPLAAYAALEMPLRLLRGDRSPPPVQRVADRLAQLPQVELVTLPGLGHMAPVTEPAQLMQALPAWLQPDAQARAAPRCASASAARATGSARELIRRCHTAA
jgi:pimeloyl-ACP methyl ester carboxylesterase